MLFAIFGIRPLFYDRFDEEAWYGKYMPSPEGETLALLVGLTAIAGIGIGAAMMNGRAAKARKKHRSFGSQFRAPIRFTAKEVLLATLAASGAYVGVLTLMAGSQIFSQLRQGRSAEVAIGGLPEIVLMVPMTGSTAAAIFLLANRHRKLSKAEFIVLLASISTSIALVSQLGNRRFIIPTILIPVVASLIRRPARVRLWHIPAALITVLIMATIPMVRAAGARNPNESLLGAAWRYLRDEGISGTIRPIFASYDTEMFDYVAILAPRMQEEGYGWGRGTLLEFVTRPIPASWGSTTSWSNELLTKLFGGGCGEPFCPVASFPGVMFFDGGLILVAVGSLIMGAFLRSLAIAWQYNSHLSFKKLMSVVIASAFALIAMRTNTIHAAWWCLYTIGISYLVYFYAAAKRPPRKREFKSGFSEQGTRLENGERSMLNI
ncbi:Uncharacterised protein [Kocuria rosea]|nr:Uncharacterised protein [Kocuria rosea]